MSSNQKWLAVAPGVEIFYGNIELHAMMKLCHRLSQRARRKQNPGTAAFPTRSSLEIDAMARTSCVTVRTLVFASSYLTSARTTSHRTSPGCVRSPGIDVSPKRSGAVPVSASLLSGQLTASRVGPRRRRWPYA